MSQHKCISISNNLNDYNETNLAQSAPTLVFSLDHGIVLKADHPPYIAYNKEETCSKFPKRLTQTFLPLRLLIGTIIPFSPIA